MLNPFRKKRPTYPADDNLDSPTFASESTEKEPPLSIRMVVASAVPLRQKRIILAFFLILPSAVHIFPQETSESVYAASAIRRVLTESPEGKVIGSSIDATELSFQRQEKTWIPTVRLNLSADAKVVRGEYRYVRNGAIIRDPQIIASPSAEIDISQRLPGNGEISIGAGYAVSCLAGQNAYIQQPYLSLGVSQHVSRGAFFLTKDPSVEILKSQRELFRLESRDAMFGLFVRFTTAVKDYDIASLELEHCEATMKKTDADYREQLWRHDAGQRNDVALFNSHMSRTQAVQNLRLAEQKLSEAESALACYGIGDITEMPRYFRNGLNKLLSAVSGEKSQMTMQEKEVIGEIRLVELSLEAEESGLSPLLYMQTSLVPDQGRDGEFSDFSRSVRNLAVFPDSWLVNATVGFSIELDGFCQRKITREISGKKIKGLNERLDVLRVEREKARPLYRKWSEGLSEYCEEMEAAMREEEILRMDIKTLLEEHMITETEYWSAEAGYQETRLKHGLSVWSMIEGKIYILRLSSDWEEFIGRFLEMET